MVLVINHMVDSSVREAPPWPESLEQWQKNISPNHSNSSCVSFFRQSDRERFAKSHSGSVH
jgi:hypothetical protein